ncbi:MAG: class IV adenylate cyclase [Gemmatimonadota bacterium]|jgi:predicted adenylyl cyclase CyaB
MARNVEIKARLDDLQTRIAAAARLADGPGETIEQEDVFYRCDSGRLKLRLFADGRGELIHYRRPDSAGPKTSDYVVIGVTDPTGLRALLDRALGVTGVVRKVRRLFRVGRTRIHLDTVEGLGDFLELEVVLADGEDSAIGEREATGLMTRLGIDDRARVGAAYIDLLTPAS